MLTAQVWTSVDGTRWEPVVDEETVFADSQMNAIVANEQGLIAWGLKQLRRPFQQTWEGRRVS